jgi:Kelch motif
VLLVTSSCSVQAVTVPRVRHHSATAIQIPPLNSSTGPVSDAQASSADALVVFGGIAGACAEYVTDQPAATDTLSSDTWLYLPTTNQWLQIETPWSQPSPVPRYKHACAAMTLRPASIVCMGGLTAGGQPLSDAWVLDVELQETSVQGTWTLLTPVLAAGPRHSFNLVPAAPADAALSTDQTGTDSVSETFLVAGGSTASAEQLLAAEAAGRRDVWQLNLSYKDKRGTPVAAWRQLFPAGELPSPTLGGAAAALTSDRKLVMFGGYSPWAAQPTHTASSWPVVQAQHVLPVDGCLQDNALAAGSPLEQAAACIARAVRSAVTLDLELGQADPLAAQVLDNMAVGIYDANGIPFMVLDKRVEVRKVPADDEIDQVSERRPRVSTDQALRCILADVLSEGNTDAWVLVTYQGLQLARQPVRLAANRSEDLLMSLQAPRPLKVHVELPEGTADDDVATELFVRFNGTRTAWSDVEGSSHLHNGVATWQVCPAL